MPDMRISQDLVVHGDEWRVEYPRRCHDDLVCGIAMKYAWQLGGLDTNAGRKFEELDSRIR
jgi:hypothetical protein